mgnify:CR=1 FL=1
MKKIIKILLTIAFVFTFLYLLQRLLMPKYMDSLNEGAMIAEYYDTEKFHDVIFFGDCEVYETYSPCILWDNYGISSYVRGSSQQLMWQTYYLIEDTLRYETPDVILVNVLSMRFSEPQNEAYNRMTIDGMRFSSSKINSILVSMLPDENIWEYLFPILRYHDRYSELTSEDIDYLFTRDNVTFAGYMPFAGIQGVDTLPAVKPLADYSFGELPMKYLQMIADLCKEKDIQLILVKTPSVFPHWYDEWEQQIVDFADRNGVSYVSLLNASDVIGIDYQMDTYDAGMHVNIYGAEKCSDYIGNILSTEYGIEDHRGQEIYDNYWNPLTEQYYQTTSMMWEEWYESQENNIE